MFNLAVIILCGGLSSRFQGLLKPLLKYKNNFFVDIITKQYNLPSYVITGYYSELLLKKLKGNYKLIYNENYPEGMFSSIKKGISSVSLNIKGVFIHPVDYPFIKRCSIQKMKEFVFKNINSIVIPSCNKRKGHPIYIPKILFQNIIYSNEISLRKVVFENRKIIKIVDIDDINMINDIDSIGSYLKWKK